MRSKRREALDKVFSGIVEESASVVSVAEQPQGRKITVESHLDHSGSKIGDSICVDGVCLTVVDISEPSSGQWCLSFDVASETLRRTTLEEVVIGSQVHLERSLKLGERIHGHIVTGHVDTIASVVLREEEGETTKLVLNLPEVSTLVAEKGSIAIAGISLTVGKTADGSFEVYLIPHTKEVTRFGDASVGSKFNVEFDVLARYVAQHLSAGNGSVGVQG